MSESDAAEPGRFYFALPRLYALIRGHSTARAETNWVEAYFVGIAVFLTGYFFVAQTIVRPQWLPRLAWPIVLAFITWIFWLLVLHVNSLIISALHGAGLFATRSRARLQNVFVGGETVLFALALIFRNAGWSFVGFAWLGIVALNLAAALLVSLLNFASRDA